MGSGIDRVWKLHGDGRTVGPGDVVRTHERLRMPYMLGLGGQHILAMFGATALVPVLTGFPVMTTIFFSGVGMTGQNLDPLLGRLFPEPDTAVGDSLVEPLAATPDPRSRPAPGT
jgi:hypothetical protein